MHLGRKKSSFLLLHTLSAGGLTYVLMLSAAEIDGAEGRLGSCSCVGVKAGSPSVSLSEN